MTAFLSLAVLSFFACLVFVAVGGPEWWEYRMRQTESVVETCCLILLDYLIKPAIFWWTYPFLRTVVPLLRTEWDKYATATHHQREGEKRAAENLRQTQRYVENTTVDRTTDGIPVVVTEREVKWDICAPVQVGCSPKPRVRVRRYPPLVPGGSFRYVSYTHENGKVDWGMERIPGQEIKLGWIKEGRG